MHLPRTNWKAVVILSGLPWWNKIKSEKGSREKAGIFGQ